MWVVRISRRGPGGPRSRIRRWSAPLHITRAIVLLEVRFVMVWCVVHQRLDREKNALHTLHCGPLLTRVLRAPRPEDGQAHLARRVQVWVEAHHAVARRLQVDEG